MMTKAETVTRQPFVLKAADIEQRPIADYRLDEVGAVFLSEMSADQRALLAYMKQAWDGLPDLQQLQLERGWRPAELGTFERWVKDVFFRPRLFGNHLHPGVDPTMEYQDPDGYRRTISRFLECLYAFMAK